jgi:quinol monooxygenase YgiN
MNELSGPSIVIAAYRPKPGKTAELMEAVKDHLPILRREGLVTNREPIVMVAKDGAVLEVFEWKSPQAIEEAHANAEVQKLWQRFAEACDYIAPAEIEELRNMFPGFRPVRL